MYSSVRASNSELGVLGGLRLNPNMSLLLWAPKAARHPTLVDGDCQGIKAEIAPFSSLRQKPSDDRTLSKIAMASWSKLPRFVGSECERNVPSMDTRGIMRFTPSLYEERTVT